MPFRPSPIDKHPQRGFESSSSTGVPEREPLYDRNSNWESPPRLSHPLLLNPTSLSMGDESRTTSTSTSVSSFPVEFPSNFAMHDELEPLWNDSDSESPPPFSLHLLPPTSPSLSEEPPASISSLPLELLREIFLWSVEPNLVTFDQHSAPLGLSHTCHLWRQLAIGIQLLWNVIFVDNFKYPARMIQLWIERVNGLPLFVHLRTLDSGIEGKVPRGTDPNIRATDILIRHAPQWQELDMTSTIAQNPGFLRLKPSMLGNLQRCRWLVLLNVHPDFDAPLTLQIFQRFWTVACSAPLLRHVELSVIPINAPWSQLTTLGLYATPFNSARNALSQCTSLDTLDWVFEDMDAVNNQPLPLKIPSLTRLRLKCPDSELFIPLFNSLILPKLSYLGLFLAVVVRNPIPSEVTRMLSHLNLPLQHFSLDGSDMLDNAVMFTLLSPCFHHLKRLSVSPLISVDGVCTLLKHSANFPTLEELDLGVLQPQPPTVLIHALHNRNNSNSTSDSDDSEPRMTSSNHISRVSLYQQAHPNIVLPIVFNPEILPGVDIYLKQYEPLHDFQPRLTLRSLLIYNFM